MNMKRILKVFLVVSIFSLVSAISLPVDAIEEKAVDVRSESTVNSPVHRKVIDLTPKREEINQKKTDEAKSILPQNDSVEQDPLTASEKKDPETAVNSFSNQEKEITTLKLMVFFLALAAIGNLILLLGKKK